MKTIEVGRMLPQDAASFSALLTEQGEDYRNSFFPFTDESVDAMKALLKNAKFDTYWGIWHGESLVAFFMLRGWDAGYTRPSFGLLVSQSQSGMGLGRLALQVACSHCLVNGIDDLMLKVDPSNQRARRLYESFGFRREGTCDRTGHDILCWQANGRPTFHPSSVDPV